LSIAGRATVGAPAFQAAPPASPKTMAKGAEMAFRGQAISHSPS